MRESTTLQVGVREKVAYTTRPYSDLRSLFGVDPAHATNAREMAGGKRLTGGALSNQASRQTQQANKVSRRNIFPATCDVAKEN